MTPEEETLEKIKYVLSCGNEAQAIRLIEQYGHWKQEQTEQLNIHSVVRQSEQLCVRCGETKEEPKDDMCMCCWQKYKNAY